MSGYDAKDITVLEGLEPVRKRPGMYIGGTGKDGLHHLVREIVDNAVDEVINGHATSIGVTLDRSGRTVSVTDNGRGIPVDMHPQVKRPALEVIFTTLHAGGKFDNGSYITSGGLHGVGSSVVNALSSNLVATVRRDGFEWQQSYRKGKPRTKVDKLRPYRGTGTTIEFTPDDEIFGEFSFDPDWIREHLDTSAYLNKGLKVSFKDDTTAVKDEFESLSNSTQIFVWSLVAIGVLAGLLLGGLIAYGVAVEEYEGRDCIQYEDTWYCAGDDAEQVDAEEGSDG